MASTDIGIAPLIHSRFNYSKSEIKYYEYALAKIPCVASNTPNYSRVIKHNENGFLVDNDPESWYEHLTMLIENIKLRQIMGNSAYKNVMENYTVQGNMQKCIDMFESL